MIAVALSGGLGNQLFEYAFIYSQHKKLHTRFFLIKSGAPADVHKYFTLDRNMFHTIDSVLFNYDGFKLFFSHYLRNAFYNIVSSLALRRTVVIDNWDDPDDALLQVRNNIRYQGYFQSEIYFKEESVNLSALFQLKKCYTSAYQQKFGWLKQQNNIVVVHIRRTDYSTAFESLNLGSADMSLPISYYHKLIAGIHHENNFYVFISDEIITVKKEFKYLENKYFSEEGEIMDFQLMLNADICVIANSSFSWWAAYLNKTKGKKVYCPKHYLGFRINKDYPSKIYPDNWIEIPVL